MQEAPQYRCPLEVRGYELDSFGHVNHAIYVSYLEHARWKMLDEAGITLAKFNEWKKYPVIGGLEISYLKPAFIGDTLEILTRVSEYGRTHLTFEHVIVRGDTQVVRAKVRCVIINEVGRPTLMPEGISRLWEGALA